MSLVDGASEVMSLSEVNEIKEVGKTEANKLLKEGWHLLAVATTKNGDFNYSVGR